MAKPKIADKVKVASVPSSKPVSAAPKNPAVKSVVSKNSAPKLKKKSYHPVILDPLANAIDPKKAATPKRKPSVEQKVLEKTKKNNLIIPHEHDSYFVYLRTPLEYRRHLLESSRKILFSLRGYQKIILIRQRKIEEMKKLKNSVKELLYLNKKFNEMLPKYNMPHLEQSEEPKIVKAPAKILTPVPARKPIPPREKTEIEKLEDSLANIEKKLKTLH